MSRGDGLPAEAIGDAGLQRVHGTWLTVHEAQASRSRRKRLQPADDLMAIGVRRHRIVLRDSRVDRHHLAVDLDLSCAVNERPASRARGRK